MTADAALGHLGRYGQEHRVGAVALHLVQDTGLGGHDILTLGMLDGILQQHSRRAHHIGHGQHRAFALGMGQHQCPRMGLLEFQYLRHRETLVHMAAAVPEQHLPAGDRVDIRPQVLVGTEDELGVLREGVDNLLGVAAGHHHIGQRLDGRRGVHVADHLIAGMLVLELPQVFGAARVGQRTACVEVGAEHHLLRRENLTGLGHEMHTAHHDHVGIGLGSLARQRQRVANEVGHLLNLAHRIVVSQDDSILLLGQTPYLSLQVGTLGNGLVDEPFFFPFLFDHRHIIIFLSFFLFFKMK